jgi:hypothetical protein
MTEEQFLAICKSKYAELEKLKEIKGFYEYEKQFDKIMTELSRTLLESSIGEVPKDRRKKKDLLPLRTDRDQ